MSDYQKYYHEMEMLQELGLLEGNISEEVELNNNEEQVDPTKELENHMVVGEYYGEGE